ncbi:MAG: twin-arginine translocase subunit TatC [Methylotenera sp.]|nr:twin-arginine translocase subunit TatC [Oligoflexia bacterium]
MTQDNFGQNNSRPVQHSSQGGYPSSGGSGSGRGANAAEAAKMGFFDHLDELRQRIMRCLYVFFAGFIGCYFMAEKVMEFLRRPLFKVMPPDQQKLYFTSLFENFLTHLKIAGYTSVFLLSPFFFFQIWGFIAPGLHHRERKLVVPFVSAATFFFLAGASFAYFILFPVGFKYFVTYGGPSEIPLLTIEAYYNTALKLILLFGLAFEMPVLVVLLGALGVVDAAALKAQRRNAIMGITIVSAMFAPPDAMSMVILAAPLIILYEASIWVVQWMGLRRAAAQPPMDPPAPPQNPLHGGSQ